jgi:hypothetical protein
MMKKIILIIILFSGCTLLDSDTDIRGCYIGGLNITSYEELRRAQNFKYTCLQGSVGISGDELEVVKLSNIEQSDGLSIIFTTRLTEVSVHNLGLGTGLLSIRQNAALKDVGHLPGASDIRIQDNPVLVSLSGLSHVTRTGSLDIMRNASLPNLKDFANLKVVDSLKIEENASFTTLSHLALEEIPFYVTIIENESLPYCDICDFLEAFVNEDGLILWDGRLKRAHGFYLHGNKPDECGDETVETALDLNCPFDFE